MRLIIDDSVSASYGLAVDDTLAQRVGVGQSPPTLRLYTYRSYCALVGRFQKVENEIHVAYCRAHRIQINRRPTGGGAIIMGSDQLGVALALPVGNEDGFLPARRLMEKFSAGLVQALDGLGLQARFRGKNDVEVQGRKIAGLGIHRAAGGGLLFHASVLVDLDVALMLRVLNTPFEKVSDKEIGTVAARVTTVRRELGSGISVQEFRQKIAQGYTTAFGVRLHQDELTSEEQSSVADLERRRYLADDWVFQSSEVADGVGSATTKTAGGLLEVRVALAGRTLKTVFIRGDFFAAADAIADLEASLRWHSCEPEAMAATLQEIYAQRGAELGTLSLSALAETIQSAVCRAATAGSRLPSQPYGCFVSPEGARG